ncbi:MAG: HD domain-containing protein [Lachnospiraceae bacterium]|nr:HD domain-containing protein [Lachnospiraceae bacterium]MDE7052119.1 HD domain-containing protein [Lachnospiraceae bacterium]
MASKRILTTKAKVNMVTSEDVYTTDNQLIIPKGTVLTEDIIAALKDHSVFAIRVDTGGDGVTPVLMDEQEQETMAEDTSSEDIAIESGILEIPEDDGIPNTSETKEFREFESSFMESVDDLKNVFNSVVMKNEEIDTSLLLSDVKEVVSKGRNSFHILDMLHCMRGYDDVTYVHCMNVALLSNLIGRTVYPEISHEELEVLTLSGLLCDIGKILVPEEVINKAGRLTLPEYNIAKTHVFHGNNILKGLNLDPRIAEVAMRHHERCDGSGYPGGFRGDQIEEFARIVAIADTYDAMTTDRPYRPAICPFDVIHMFEREGLVRYDVKFLLQFLEKAAHAYVNTKVKLSTGETGRVIMINRKELSKPVVKVGDKYYDLSTETSIRIQNIII